MTMLRMLPAFLTAAFALAAGPAQAQMKSQWVEYSHGDTKLKAYMAYDECWYCMPCEVDCPTGAVKVNIPYLLK